MKNQSEEQPIKSEISVPSWHSNKVTLAKGNWQKPALIIVIIIIILIGGAYVANQQQTSTPPPLTTPQPTPTPLLAETSMKEGDETANWKTYTNSESGYSVKYPSDKFIRHICQGEELLLEERTKGETKDVIEKPNCTRDFYYDIEIRTVGNPANNPMPTRKSDTFYKVTQEQITIGNNSVSATRYVSELIGAPEPDGPFAKRRLEIYIPHNASIHILTSEKKELEEVMNQILSTFRFLDTETSDGQMSVDEKKRIDSWVTKNNLNEYGDSKDRMYLGGTPLFNEATGETIDRYAYILSNHTDRPWNK